MSTVPNRKLIVKPIRLGPYSRAIVLPAWWLKLNANPSRIEIGFTLDSLILKPAEEKQTHDTERTNQPGNTEPK